MNWAYPENQERIFLQNWPIFGYFILAQNPQYSRITMRAIIDTKLTNSSY